MRFVSKFKVFLLILFSVHLIFSSSFSVQAQDPPPTTDADEDLFDIIKNFPGIKEILSWADAYDNGEGEGCASIEIKGHLLMEVIYKNGTTPITFECFKMDPFGNPIIDCNKDGVMDDLEGADTWLHLDFDLDATFRWYDAKCKLQTFHLHDKQNKWIHIPDGNTRPPRNWNGYSRQSQSWNTSGETIGSLDKSKCKSCNEKCKVGTGSGVGISQVDTCLSNSEF